ncbi:hypothetical protein [Priestia megaterium]|uniref:hypothetical protein n=1 Tax=Priestia megaterium TaxID=1404 RepID=UPI000BFD3488|nr:hypothetical protein [Priestia megaterium]PGQ88196.1 hypothetical protein COA18_04530 [Priestia megaterium]
MIKISNFQIKLADRIYGDFAEKVAFNLSIDPAAVLGSIAGGYAANSHYQKSQAKSQDEELQKRRIENNTYSQVESVMRDLKIVFTPINVIYSVNGQVFEIISTDEMNPYMRNAFQQKDANYFRDLLVNKINMEMQLAEQAFAQRLLAAGGHNEQAKEASFISKQDALVKVAEDHMDEMMKTASGGLDNIKFQISPSLNSIRPFDHCEFFCNPRELSKVASIFDLFDPSNSEDISLNRINDEVNVGFLPDRVVYTWNGQLIEQMSVLRMNEEGYEAFKKKDKQFFIDFFKQHTKETAEALESPEPREQTASETEEARFDTFHEDQEEFTKDAAALEDVVEDLVEEEFPVIERESIDLFRDPDIHPVAYDYVLNERYGDDWTTYELEALLKQIEVDFELRDGIAENPLNKISILHAVSSEEHTMYQAPLTFEKFMRGVNSKSILFEEFQGNLSFEEILFGLEVAKAYDGEEVFLQFHDNISAYVAEELMNEGVRFVSDEVYDESNPSEKDFFTSVNGFLTRKWKERDAQGVLDETGIDQQHTMTVQITEIADEVLHEHADQIQADDPYTSIKKILGNGLLEPVDTESRTGVANMATETVVAHFMSGVFLEYKHQELTYTLEKLQEEGVIRG